jgi:hypothetical protein
VVDGITVDALADPERYPPGRQLALLHRALDRLGLPTEGSPPSPQTTSTSSTSAWTWNPMVCRRRCWA